MHYMIVASLEMSDEPEKRVLTRSFALAEMYEYVAINLHRGNLHIFH